MVSIFNKCCAAVFIGKRSRPLLWLKGPGCGAP